MNLSELPWVDVEDKDAVQLVKQYLPHDPVIIEAGTCDAEDTLRFKNVWPKAKVYGFEPVPTLFAKSFTLTLNVLGVEIYNCALAGSCGNKQFCESTAMPGASSFFADNLKNIDVPEDIVEEMEKDGRTYRDIQTIVECITIDEFCSFNRINRVNFIWLDTEGYELEILKGAKEILPIVTVVLLELNFQEFRVGIPLFEEVYNFMVEKGFELKHIWQARPNWQANGVFVRKFK